VQGDDSMDELFKTHDIETYFGNPYADSNLARGLRDLPADPRIWKRPPQDITYALWYRAVAATWFHKIDYSYSLSSKERKHH
jgi:hypothetical protein